MNTKNSAELTNTLFEHFSTFLSSLPEDDYLTFMIKGRSNPSAAFAELHRNFLTAVEEDKRLANEFSKFVKNFHGVALSQEDAAIIAGLKKRHGDLKPEIKIGSLPPQIGPGLALLYDTAVESLRSGYQPTTHMFEVRTIRLIEKSLNNVMGLISSANVTAYELALKDKNFANKLRSRANELNTIMPVDDTIMPVDNTPGICEYCEISWRDQYGHEGTYCGTQEQCEALGSSFIILLIILALANLIDWLS